MPSLKGCIDTNVKCIKQANKTGCIESLLSLYQSNRSFNKSIINCGGGGTWYNLLRVYILQRSWTSPFDFYQLPEDDSDHRLDPDTEKYFSSGEYLFFDLYGFAFGIRKVPEQSTKGSISGYPLLILGFISLVSILIISKKVVK